MKKAFISLITLLAVVITSCQCPCPEKAFFRAGPDGDYDIVTIARSYEDCHEFVIGKNGAFEHWPGCLFCQEEEQTPPVCKFIIREIDQGTTVTTVTDTVFINKHIKL